MTEPSTDIVLRQDSPAPELINPTTDSWTAVLHDVAALAGQIEGTDFVPLGLRDSSAKITAAILHGRELGLPPMTALASTHIVNGRPGISAEAMRALVFQAGHEVIVTESTGATCTIKGRRAGSQEWTTVTWTMAMAQAAGLVARNPQTWKSYPRQMLQARATTELCRLIFPDVIHGMRSIEELEDLDAGAEAVPAVTSGPEQPAEQRSTVSRKRRPARPEPAVEAPQEPTPEKPARQRPPLPTRGGEPPAPTAAAAAQAEQEAQRERERQQAELRRLAAEHRQLQGQEQPAEGQEQDEPPPVADLQGRAQISPSQRAALMAKWSELGVKDRDQRLLYTAFFAGLDRVDSTNQLTVSDGIRVLTALETIKTPDQLQQALQTDTLPMEGNDQ